MGNPLENSIMEEQRAMIRFLVAEGEKGSNIHELLKVNGIILIIILLTSL